MTTEQAQDQAEASASRLLYLYGLYVAGEMTAPDFTRNAALGMYASKIVASRLADITVSSIANLPPLGIVPSEEHMERLENAVQTIIEDAEAPEDPEDLSEAQEAAQERLSRVAEAETLLSHRATLHAAIRDQGYPEWLRVVEPGACEICAPLAGQIQPISVGFKDHPGCRCSLLPHGTPTIPKTPVRKESSAVRVTRGVQRV